MIRPPSQSNRNRTISRRWLIRLVRFTEAVTVRYNKQTKLIQLCKTKGSTMNGQERFLTSHPHTILFYLINASLRRSKKKKDITKNWVIISDNEAQKPFGTPLILRQLFKGTKWHWAWILLPVYLLRAKSTQVRQSKHRHGPATALNRSANKKYPWRVCCLFWVKGKWGARRAWRVMWRVVL